MQLNAGDLPPDTVTSLPLTTEMVHSLFLLLGPLSCPLTASPGGGRSFLFQASYSGQSNMYLPPTCSSELETYHPSPPGLLPGTGPSLVYFCAYYPGTQPFFLIAEIHLIPCPVNSIFLTSLEMCPLLVSSLGSVLPLLQPVSL